MTDVITASVETLASEWAEDSFDLRVKAKWSVLLHFREINLTEEHLALTGF